MSPYYTMQLIRGGSWDRHDGDDSDDRDDRDDSDDRDDRDDRDQALDCVAVIGERACSPPDPARAHFAYPSTRRR